MTDSTEAMYARMNAKAYALKNGLPIPVSALPKLRTANFPLEQWINTIDLAIRVGLTARSVHNRLQGRTDVEKRSVKYKHGRVTEWRWRR